MGTKSWEWEGMGTRKLFQHISRLKVVPAGVHIFLPRDAYA